MTQPYRLDETQRASHADAGRKPFGWVGAALVVLAVASSGEAFSAERIIHQGGGDASESIEIFLERPTVGGPWPVILFVHGHQSRPRPGARVFDHLDRRPALATVDEGRLAKMRQRGYLAAAVSLPGYGATTGPPDFWGPRSQATVRRALDLLLTLPNTDRTKVVLYGVSSGAATAAMIATVEKRISTLILVAGLYDLGAAYPTGDAGLDTYIEREAGTTEAAFSARAALRNAGRISAATLVLHGGEDNRGGTLGQARSLAAKLRAAETPVQLHVFPNTPHGIPILQQWQEIDPFLRRVVGR